MTHLVFVYGTLRSGQPNNALMDGSLIGMATVEGVLHNAGGFPGLRPAAGRYVRGEVWEVPEETLARLDRLEGVHVGLFSRVRVHAVMDCPDLPIVVRSVWAYQFGEQHAARRPVLDGETVDWVAAR